VKTLLFAILSVWLGATTFPVSAQTPEDPNNIVVRFDVRVAGTNFGTMDVELFQDKPETVKNFLLYLYSGAYSNTFFSINSRLLDSWFLAGGDGRVLNATSTNAFTTFIPNPAFGGITNEFHVGTTRLNTFGTLTALRSGGVNTAQNGWFFNLRHNSALDSNVVHAVFGRVINTDGPRTGTNLLNYFANATTNNGIASHVTASPLYSLGQLPVHPTSTNTNPRPITYRDLFTVNVSIVSGATLPPPDRVRPVLRILEPRARSLSVGSNQFASVAGTASDKGGVARVFFDSPLGRFAVSGTTNWSTSDASLVGGTNALSFYAVDWRGNVSKPVVRRVERVMFSAITLRTNGPGAIEGLTNGQVLQVGRIYKVKAVPAPGWAFDFWGGNYSATEPSISISAGEDATLEANFYRPIGLVAKGSYIGVFHPTNDGPARSSGLLSLDLLATSAIRGRFQPIGPRTYGIRSTVSPKTGFAQLPGRIGNQNVGLAVLVVTNGTNLIFVGYSDNQFRSYGTLRSVAPHSATNPPAEQGSYTFVIAPPDEQSAVAGYGFGTAVVDVNGKIRASGFLGDGAPIAQTTSLLEGHQWAFHSYSKLGAAIGTVLFQTNAGTFSSSVRWFDDAFGDDTNRNVSMAGGRYSPSAPAVNWTIGTATFSGGGLNGAVNEPVSYENGAFEVQGANAHNVQISSLSTNGTVSGTFNHPSLGSVSFQGAVLQTGNKVAGFFRTPTGAGTFKIQSP
jgi:cyclophilin family peptidyl-prolyl cis-trans isomerase